MRNMRAIAAKVITEVIKNKVSLNETIHQKISYISDVNEKVFIYQLCCGTVRWFFRLNFIAKNLLNKPIKASDTDVYSLILLGLYQLIHLRVEKFAAITETVLAARELNKVWAVNLINDTLRSFLKTKDELIANSDWNKEARFSHPNWLLNMLQHAWPVHYQKMVFNNNENPPLMIRINRNKIIRDEYSNKLTFNGIEHNLFKDNDIGIKISKPIDPKKLPGYIDGVFSVQDFSEQIVTDAIDINNNGKILLFLSDSINLVSSIAEINEHNNTFINIFLNDKLKNKLVNNELNRLIKNSNKIKIISKVDNIELYDRIIFNPPSSNVGLIKRSPDIKIIRNRRDIDLFSEKQIILLKELWTNLRDTGKLLYLTSSVLPKENYIIINKFMKVEKTSSEIQLNNNFGIKLKHGRQLLPSDNNDGRYYCLLTKNNK